MPEPGAWVITACLLLIAAWTFREANRGRKF